MMLDEYARGILLSLWNTYALWIEKNDIKKAIDNEKILDEFFFVVLGGYGISYEENLSALEVLKKRGYTSRKLYENVNEYSRLIEDVKTELSKRQFKPIKRNGEFRRYRFANNKSKEFVHANCWLWKECGWDIRGKLEQLDMDGQRKWLCKCPGIGLKSSSWLLRNVGYNENLAVLDVHILRFLSHIGFDIPISMNETSYLSIEAKLQDICNSIGVSLGKMDYLLWVLGRQGLLDDIRGN